MTRTLASLLTLGILTIGSSLAFTGCSAPDDPSIGSWGNSNNGGDGGYGALVGFFHEFDNGIAAKHHPADSTSTHAIPMKDSISVNSNAK
jgi:hypothetical protein